MVDKDTLISEKTEDKTWKKKQYISKISQESLHY